MMRALIILIATLATATQAVALSCIRPDPAASFVQYRDAPEPYYIMHGRLQFDESLLPQGVVNEERTPDPIPATFVGHGLTEGGFNVVLRRPVTLQSVCYGPWCGGMQSGVDALIFARVIDDGITLEVDPCGTTVFAEPAPEVLDLMTTCLNGGTCTPAR